MGKGHLTDVAYWDRNWASRPAPDPLDPARPGLNGTMSRSLHRFFERFFVKLAVKPGDLIVEAGSGGSIILPYFKTQFQLRAEGIENSPVGTETSRAIAAKSGVETPIHDADLFKLPPHLLQRYDIVFSYGLVEHFLPTTLILDQLKSIARPGGHLVTLIPNMRGVVGWLQKVANPEVFAIHVPLSAAELAQAHRDSGLEVIEYGYIMTVNFSAINFAGSGRLLSGAGPRLASWGSKLVWLAESLRFPEMPNALTSPYAFVIARKKTELSKLPHSG